MAVVEIEQCVLTQESMKLIILFNILFSLNTVHAQAVTEGSGDETPAAHEPINVAEFKKEEETLLQRNQPFYFAYGRPTSKLQLSFKVPLIKKQPIFFAYTQQMFWNL